MEILHGSIYCHLCGCFDNGEYFAGVLEADDNIVDGYSDAENTGLVNRDDLVRKLGSFLDPKFQVPRILSTRSRHHRHRQTSQEIPSTLLDHIRRRSSYGRH